MRKQLKKKLDQTQVHITKAIDTLADFRVMLEDDTAKSSRAYPLLVKGSEALAIMLCSTERLLEDINIKL